MIEKESAKARLEVTAVQKDIETAKRSVAEAEKALPPVKAATQQISERLKSAATDLKIIKRPAEAPTAPELAPDEAKQPATAAKAVIDEFDNAAAWRSETWADNAAISGDGERLTVDLQPGTAGKFAISRSLPPAAQFGTDETLVVEVENKADAVALTVAITLNAYYESTARPLKAGMNRIAFRMSDRNFKTKATAWKHTATLPAKRRIKNLTLVLYTRKAGQVVFDRLSIEADKP
jgi:flagellar hook-length control protein FliK